MARPPRAYVVAAERWGFLADAQAHKYGIANGATLLLKIASGESGFNMKAVSSADAKGATQFIPSTRAEYVKHYGVDPWKSPEEAIHAAAIYMHTSGLAAYNPGGGQGYIDYIKKQPISPVRAGHQLLPGGQKQPRESAGSESSGGPSGFAGDLLNIGLVGALVLGGAGMVLVGTTRLLGTQGAQ